MDFRPKKKKKSFQIKTRNMGVDIDKNAVQKIESGQRFITDIELKIISSVLNVSYEYLLD